MIALLVYTLLAHAGALGPCHANGLLPDPTCSPGMVAATSLEIVCGTSTRTRRHVTRAMKRRVLAEYGVSWDDRALYEIDHVIPLALGGGNAIENLWPQPSMGAEAKDRLEDDLHRRVCSGSMPLATAQSAIAKDWVRASEELRR